MGKVSTPGSYEVAPSVVGEVLDRLSVQAKWRVQIPKKVREKLNLKKGDDIYWVEHPDGRIYITKAVKL